MVSYYRPIVTLCLKCTVFKIWRHIGWKSPKKPTPLSYGTFLWGDPLRIFRQLIPCQKLESWGYQTVYISRSCFRSARHTCGHVCTRPSFQLSAYAAENQRVGKTRRRSIYSADRHDLQTANQPASQSDSTQLKAGKYWRVTDGRPDGQTDTSLSQRPALA